MTSPEELNNNYNNTEKCKISWKIENIVKSSYDNCAYKLEITIKENNNYYDVISSELKNSDWSDFCIVDTTFPFYKTWNISYYPKVWDDFKWIIKKSDKDYPVLSYWEEVYNNFTWSECESNYSQTKIQIDPQDKCKAHWIIEKIITPPNRDTTYYNKEILFKYDNTLFNTYIITNNSNYKWTLLYNLSWNNYPKVWDEIYTIQEYWTNYLIATWKNNYDDYLYLPDCSKNFDDIVEGFVIDDNQNNTWSDIKNTELTQKENTISLKKDNQKTQTTQKVTTTKSWSILKTTSNTWDIIKFAWNEITKNTNSWSFENSWNILNLTWSNLVQNIETWIIIESWTLNSNSWANISTSNSWIIQKSEKTPENNSNYALFWSLILALIIIWVLVFKLFKIKK